MLHVVFVLAVVLGFILWFLASWPRQPAPPPYAETAARFCFAVAAIIFAVEAFGGGR
ncbi:MAG TPA: hypothetical protein VGF50_14230 [Caulobacteraceae bacterium]